MKKQTMKKVLSLILAVVMIALALPLTLPVMAEEGAAATIKAVDVTVKRAGGAEILAQYGSIAGITDGDAFDSTRSADDSWPYFYSEYLIDKNFAADNKFYYLNVHGKLVESVYEVNNVYRAYAVIELNNFSKINDMTIWLGADGHNASSAAAWSNPTLNWNMNEAYDILGSLDGETWFVIDEFDKMCGTGSAKGENFPSEGDADYASKTVDGYLRVGHKIDMKDQTVRYISVAVKKGNNEIHKNTGAALHAIFFGDITVNGEEVAAPTSGYVTAIKYAKMFSKYSDEWDVHANYGSVASMIDGDPKPGYVPTSDNKEKRSNYTYYQSDDLYDGITYYYLDAEGKLVLDDPDGTTGVYMGFAMFQLNAKSALQDITVWLAADEAAEWKDPSTTWNINDEYDILVSNDGESWTVVKSYTDMCGDGTNKGANFPAEGDAALAVGTDGKLGHKIALDGIEAKYFAIGVKHGMNSVKDNKERNTIVIGEVSVNGTTVEAEPTVKSPAEIYAEAQDGEVLKTVNFKDMTWSDDYANSDNWNSYVKVSEDGTTARHQVHTTKTFGATNKRAMWGGIAAEESFSLDDGSKYTIYFDAEFSSTKENIATIGVQVDDSNTLLIDGYGYSYWYAWNTKEVDKSDGNDEYDKWNDHIDGSQEDKQSFAVEVDPVNEEMTLFIAGKDGTYNKVRTLTYTDADISGTLSCRIYTRTSAGSGTPWVEVSDLRICKGIGYADKVKFEAGAAVRMDEPTGLRFTGAVQKSFVDGLKTQYGADNVEIGMLITPTDYLTNNGLNFTKADLDACTAITGVKYLEIDAQTILEDGNDYVVNCAIVNILEGNYDRAFSAILYVKVNDGTNTTYTYSTYTEANNSRSVAEVAEAAYYDYKDAEAEGYTNAITVDGATKYSPYTEEQRNTLYGFFG